MTKIKKWELMETFIRLFNCTPVKLKKLPFMIDSIHAMQLSCYNPNGFSQM